MNNKDENNIKYYLDKKENKYNCFDFIELDPISIPHKFTTKEDIEISGFLTATIAWGNRKAILKSANQLMEWMDNTPHDFILNHSNSDLKIFENYKYRTFNGIDCVFFIKSLRNIYENFDGIENVVNHGYKPNSCIKDALIYFREIFFLLEHEQRTEKHFANVEKNSSAKRLNMYFRWMIRSDDNGVDFGLWNKIKTSDLMIPLDVHSGTIARKLNLLQRNANDWKAVAELTENLKQYDANDPIKYDFALFGLGVNNDF